MPAALCHRQDHDLLVVTKRSIYLAIVSGRAPAICTYGFACLTSHRLSIGRLLRLRPGDNPDHPLPCSIQLCYSLTLIDVGLSSFCTVRYLDAC
jgi:hypothetical protein